MPDRERNSDISSLNRLIDERFHRAAKERDEINVWLEGGGSILVSVVAGALVLVGLYMIFGGRF